MPADTSPVPTVMPLGDRSVLIRFADALDLGANAAAIDLAARLGARRIPGVEEIAPNLVSVLVRYDPLTVSHAALAGEIRLAMGQGEAAGREPAAHTVPIRYGGAEGPDLEAVADALKMTPEAFIAAHGASPLRVLAVGFAPGFLYCGLHDEALTVPRRETVRGKVPVGSVLFAAGQTAIAATPLPTGWPVIGRTDFLNFDAARTPPTRAQAGDTIRFEAVS